MEESVHSVEDPAIKRRRERAENDKDQPTDPNVQYVYSNIGESIQDDEEIDAFENSD